MATLDDISTEIETLSGYARAAFAPRIGSAWAWTDDQADTDIRFANDDYGALITTLVLGSAGALQLVEVTYTVGFAGGSDDLSRSTFKGVIRTLERRGAVDAVDFEMLNITPGGVVLPGRNTMAVLPYPLVRELTIFQVDMTWETVVTGERTAKDIHLAPRLDPPLPGRRSVPPVRTMAEVHVLRPVRTS